jgi:Calx-beta domain-containing protein
MATQVGVVSIIIGTATATAVDGTIRNLQLGDKVYADELISTGSNSVFSIKFADDTVISLGRDVQLVLDEAVYNPNIQAEVATTLDTDAIQQTILAGVDPLEIAEIPTTFDIDAIQQILLSGVDPRDVIEATAAGVGQAGNEGLSNIQIEHLAPEVIATSGFETRNNFTTVAVANVADDETLIPIDLNQVEFSIIALSGSEGGQQSSAIEGEVASYIISYDGSLSSGVQASVTFDTASGTIANFDAIEGVDFDKSTGTLTFTGGSGVTSAVVYVQTTVDLAVENDETYSIKLISTSTNSTINPAKDHVDTTIIDGSVPVVSIESGIQNNGAIVEEGSALSYVVSLSEASNRDAVVDLSFSGGTADTTDYTPVFYSDAGLTNVITSLTFIPGQIAKIIYVGTLDNDPPFNEVNETVNVTVTASSGATGTDEAIGTITDNDLPVVSIEADTLNNSGIVEEGAALSYVVSLSGASDQDAVIDLSFSGGTADSATDYTPIFYSDAGLTDVITSLTFTPGQTEKNIYVGTLNNDPPLNEIDETLNVTASASSGATGSDEAIGTITDNTLPVVSIAPDTLNNGDIVEEGGVLSYVVSLSAVSDQDAVVALSFSGGTADNTMDYTPIFYNDAGLTEVITSLTFTPGQTEKIIYVGTLANDPPFNEVNETVNVTVTGAAGATGSDEAVGTITDSILPVVSIEADTLNNGDLVEEGGVLSYVVSLSGASDQDAVVDLSFSGGTADNTTDYTAIFYSDADLTNAITSLTFTPGQLVKTIYVDTLDNDPPFNEVNETVNVKVSVSGATPIATAVLGTDEAIGTITDSDLPVVSIEADFENNAAIVEEGLALSYVVSLSGASDQDAVIDLSFSGGTADSATDYTPIFYSDAGLTDVITSLTFSPGQTEKNIYVGTLNNDPPLNEVDETVNVTVSVTDVATLSSGVTGSDEAIGVITDNDLPLVSIEADNLNNGDIVEEGGVLSYVVSLSAISDQDAVVGLSFSGGTADDTTDYTPRFYSDVGLTTAITFLTFTPGETEKNVYVGTLNNDPPFNEVNETVNVTVTGASGATGVNEAVGTITDSTLPTVSITTDDIVEEGAVLSYVVSLSGVSEQDAVVALSFSGGTADNATDYTPTFYSDSSLTTEITTLTFIPGEIVKTIYVGTLDNDPPLNEVTETVNVTVSAVDLSPVANGVIGSDEAVGSITDIDLPMVTIEADVDNNAAVVEEGNALSYVVKLSGVSDQDAVIDLSFSGGTADNTTDYTPLFYSESSLTDVITSVTFTPGEIEKNIYVGTLDNDPPLNEVDETIHVTASAASGATGTNEAIGIILDNDLPVVSIAADTLNNGDIVEEGGVLSYVVSLSAVSDQDAVVALGFSGGTADDTTDYTPTFYSDSSLTNIITSVTFTPGETEKNIYVGTLNNDPPFNEVNETVNVMVTGASGATGSDEAIGTITDSDLPVVNIEPDTVNNGDIVEEGGVLSYVVSLSGASDQDAVVDLSFSGGTADNTTDYTPVFYSDAGLTNVITSLTFTPDQITKTIYVGTIDNDPPLNEVNETVNVTVTAVSGATGTDEAIGTITDNEFPVVTIKPDTENNGDIVEEGAALSYVVSLSGASDQDAVIDLSFSGGTADSATDYTPVFYSDAGLTNVITSLTFSPGQTEKNIYVGTLNNDPPLNEVDETVNVTVSVTDVATLSSGVTGSDEAIGVITDNDLPLVSIEADNLNNGDIVEEGGVLSYVVSLSAISDQDAVVGLSFSGGTADDTTDYTPRFYSDVGLTTAITFLTFTPGETEKNVYVGTLNNDPPFNEVNETVNVTVTGASGATGVNEAVGTITDSTLPTVSITTDDIVEEGAVLSYVVSLSGVSEQDAVVALSFSGGTADNATDYTPTFYSDSSLTTEITTLTFIPGEIVKTIYVGTLDNDPPLNEVTETVNVTVSAVDLSPVANGVIGSDEAVGSITDIDLPMVTIEADVDNNAAVVEEGNALSYVVKLSGVSDQDAVIDLSFSGGTADNTTDYTPLFYSESSLTDVITSVTFTPGEIEKNIYVGTLDNDPPLNEVDETIHVTASAASGATGTNEAIGIILDNDLPVVSIAADTLNNGDIVEEGGVLSYVVSLSAVSDQDAVVALGFSGGTADDTTDYTPTFYSDSSLTNIITSVTFTPGETEKNIYVGTLNNDPPFNEVNETVNVMVTGASGATGSDEAIGTITDSDLPVVNIEPDTVNNGDIVEEGGVLSYVVSLSGASDQDAVVDLSFSGGTADNTTDYTPVFYSDAGLTNVITSLTFTPDQITKTIYVGTIDNDPPLNEVNETVNVTVTAVSGATGTDEAIGTITDNEFPVVTIKPDTENNGDIVEEGAALSYVVSLSGASDQDAVIDLSFSGGTADSATDYTPVFYSDAGLTNVITSLTFSPGQTEKNIYVATLDNDPPLNEIIETVKVTATASSGAAGSDEAIAIIIDSSLPVVSIEPDTLNNGDIVEEGNTLSYVVSLSGTSDQDAVVALSFSGGTADNTTDYTPLFYSDAGLTQLITFLTFTPGQTEKTIYVDTIDNDPPTNEPNETVNVTVTGVFGATGIDEAIGTITDTDLPELPTVPYFSSSLVSYESSNSYDKGDLVELKLDDTDMFLPSEDSVGKEDEDINALHMLSRDDSNPNASTYIFAAAAAYNGDTEVKTEGALNLYKYDNGFITQYEATFDGSSPITEFGETKVTGLFILPDNAGVILGFGEGSDDFDKSDLVFWDGTTATKIFTLPSDAGVEAFNVSVLTTDASGDGIAVANSGYYIESMVVSGLNDWNTFDKGDLVEISFTAGGPSYNLFVPSASEELVDALSGSSTEVLDVSALLSGIDGVDQNNIDEYLRLIDTGTGVEVRVDDDGTENGVVFTAQAMAAGDYNVGDVVTVSNGNNLSDLLNVTVIADVL